MSEERANATRLWPVVTGMHLNCYVGGTDDGTAPLVLLHGGGLDHALFSWGSVFDSLAVAHRVIAPDLPGYGESDAPADAPYTLDWYVGVLAGLLDALGIARAHLAGVSLGGGIALGFALRHPERVGKLVLVGSYGLGAAIPGGVVSALALRIPGVSPLTYALLAHSRTLTHAALRAVLVDHDRITPAFEDEVRRSLRRPGSTRAWQRFQRHEVGLRTLATDFRPHLPALRPPTLFLHGASDGFIPPHYAAEAHALIPGSRLDVFSACGHWVPRDQPERFAAAVNAFLAES